MDPTLGSWLPHVRIRPSDAGRERAQGGFELDLEPDWIDVGGASFELSRHLSGKHAAVEQAVERRLSCIIAAPDPGTPARLADQLTHWVEDVDVIHRHH